MPLPLSTEQNEAILTAAAHLVHAAACDRTQTVPDPTFAGAADLPVGGIFVSLKRGKHLRGCCGGLHDRLQPLNQVLFEAAQRTVLDDPRFPPISPAELPHLQMEVWLLHSPQPMLARGEERVAKVIIGKHGLTIARDAQRGLLLPGVAVDHQWDARRFLEQVCVKAGLHPALWKDDATQLGLFEGEVLRAHLAELLELEGTSPAAPVHLQDLPAYGEFFADSVWALLRGALPMYYQPQLADANVAGVVATLELLDRSGKPLKLDLLRFALRPGIPLQATLFGLAQEAAGQLSAARVDPYQLELLTGSVTILSNPALHGTVAEHDLHGIDPKARAVLVMERTRAGLSFDPSRSPMELVEEAARLAEVRSPGSASVSSLVAATAIPRLALSAGPRPQLGRSVRPPAVAGTFYPASAADLNRLIDSFLEGAVETAPWPAAMVPHAGLVYSGRLAADVLKRIQIPDRVLVLGPKHTPNGMEWAVAPNESWALPTGTLAGDPAFARRLVEAIPGLALDAAAHQTEHAIEVELPFLARLAPTCKVTGIVLGQVDLPGCLRFAAGLAQVLRQEANPPLLLISSDMNHFATDAETRILDEMALAALENLDPREMFETVTENHISMCGVMPAVIVLETLRLLGRLKRARRVGYATSADVTGQKDRVVGYAGMLFG